MFIFGLSACANYGSLGEAKYYHLQSADLDEHAAAIERGILATHKSAKDDDKNALAAQWTRRQMTERAEALAIRGLPLKVVHNNQYDHLSNQPELLNKFFEGSPDFRDYLAYSSLAVMARAVERSDRDRVFDLEILHRFKGPIPSNKIAVSNVDQEHFGVIKRAQAHKLSDGQICLFFLSPTYTEYRRIASRYRELNDPSVMMESFPRFCEQENGRYTFTKSGDGEPPLFRDDILTLSPPVKKHTQRPTHLPRTNILAMRGEWDVFVIDDDKFSKPYGVLSVAGYSLHLNTPCSIPHSFAHYIMDGKFRDDYSYLRGTKIPELLKTVDKTCLDTPGNNYTKSFLDGTFYGDRKTIWFEGPYISFIANRSDRLSSPIWSRKYLAVEACILDHPKIGADKYWGYKRFKSDSNPEAIFTLAGDGIDHWNDCKPEYPVEVETVKYGLIFLEAKALEIKADISAYSSEDITGGRVKRKTNSIDVRVNPDWARKNQDIIKRLTDKHPYIEWREDLIPDVIPARAPNP